MNQSNNLERMREFKSNLSKLYAFLVCSLLMLASCSKADILPIPVNVNKTLLNKAKKLSSDYLNEIDCIFPTKVISEKLIGAKIKGTSVYKYIVISNSENYKGAITEYIFTIDTELKKVIKYRWFTKSSKPLNMVQTNNK